MVFCNSKRFSNTNNSIYFQFFQIGKTVFQRWSAVLSKERLFFQKLSCREFLSSYRKISCIYYFPPKKGFLVNLFFSTKKVDSSWLWKFIIELICSKVKSLNYSTQSNSIANGLMQTISDSTEHKGIAHKKCCKLQNCFIKIFSSKIQK